MCLFFVGPGPVFCLVLLWFAFQRNANLAGGFAGRRVSWFFSWFVLVFRILYFCMRMATVLCTALAIFASASVRTEPRATSAVPEEKKSGSPAADGISIRPTLAGRHAGASSGIR